MTLPKLTLPISPTDPTLIIAELSANHNGQLSRALKTIRAAAEAGADAIKIQTYTADTLTIACDRSSFQIKGGPWGGQTLHQLYKSAFMPWEWHATLKQAAEEVGLPLFSTPFDNSAVDFLEELGVDIYKVASFELVDLELIEKIASMQKPVIMSTGMGNLTEIDEAVRTIRRVWNGVDHGLALLRCVSAYPAPPEQMNLHTIPHLAQAFGTIPGLSDHTLGTTIPIAAVALGARVIEKHFTLARADGGADSHFSLEPAELREMVTSIRMTEAALGKVRYGAGAAEAGSIIFRRSIFVTEDIAKDEPLTRKNTRVIRPGNGLAPRHIKEVLGRRAATDILRGTPLSWELMV